MISEITPLNRRNVLSMMRASSTAAALVLFALSAPAQSKHSSLRIYAVDVEGGKATLYVSPSGESMLIDTGYDGNNNRDANRIVAAASDAGVKQIDYVVISHYYTTITLAVSPNSRRKYLSKPSSIMAILTRRGSQANRPHI